MKFFNLSFSFFELLLLLLFIFYFIFPFQFPFTINIFIFYFVVFFIFGFFWVSNPPLAILFLLFAFTVFKRSNYQIYNNISDEPPNISNNISNNISQPYIHKSRELEEDIVFNHSPPNFQFFQSNFKPIFANFFGSRI